MDRATPSSLLSRMARRNEFDPLEPTSEARWYVVRDAHRATLEVRALAPGSDLKRVFVAAMLERIDSGWKVGEFSSRNGSFFCARGAQRCMVGIESADPGQHAGYGAAHLADSPTRQL